MVLDVFRGAPGPLLASPGLLWVAFGGALGVSGGVFLMIFLVRRGLRSENGEMLENDDHYCTLAVFFEVPRAPK